MKSKLKDLPKNPIGCVIYLRRTGETYACLNDTFHIKVKLKNNLWIADNEYGEELNPEEVVEVIQIKTPEDTQRSPSERKTI